ncbi:MAG: GNAT family N-acetyltransferase [Dermatophilaceae bacterium]
MTTVDDSLQHHNREAGRSTYDMSGFTVEVATAQDWQIVTEWGNGENWNIGPQDAECFRTIDPEGFFLGRVEGRPVSAVSLLNYSDDFAVWGHYLVAPDERGKGYGIEVCKTASRHSGQRVTAGDAMPEQVDNYAKDGSRPAHRTVHWFGTVAPTDSEPADSIREVTAADLNAVADYEAEAFPAHRRRFLERWLFADGHRALLATGADGAVAGFGVVRPAPRGHRVGPLVANTPELAGALLRALVAGLPAGEELSVFAPDHNEATEGLLRSAGLAPHFHVVRMYRGEPRPHHAERVYAISSLEVG